MELSNVFRVENLTKQYKEFRLDIPELNVPKGFATAIIGENGAGKTTLINSLAGINLSFKGEIHYFDEDTTDVDSVKERIGYTGPGNYFLPHWSVKQIGEIGSLLFKNFDTSRYYSICESLGIDKDDMSKKVSGLSDGNKMKLIIASVLARDTECLLMDEPASPLDPLMRNMLCDIIRNYIAEGQGQRSVIFSTHNISDMENVTDYCIFMEQGKIVERGFVEDLKEKYILIKGEAQDAQNAAKYCCSFNGNSYGFEGICLAENLDRLAGFDIITEIPNLFQISVAIMQAHSTVSMKF